LDTTPPLIELSSHTVGGVISGNVHFKGTVSDPNGIRSFEYSEDGIKWKPMRGIKRGTRLDFSFSLKTTILDDGPFVYYLRALDNTGAASEKPFLFFISNKGPELEVYSPEPNEDSFGSFVVSGRAYARIGISKLTYEYGRTKGEIDIRPGDPFWNVKLEAGGGSTLKITAFDKVGNVAVVTRRLEDRRKVKTPVVVIDYPYSDGLKALSSGGAIYGHILGAPKSVIVNGLEIESVSSFRIDPQMIPPGKKTIKITPVAADNSKGATLSISTVKAEATYQELSQITVTSPEKFSWQSGRDFSLQGKSSPNARIEFRLNPGEGEAGWKNLSADSSGNFSTNVSIFELQEGPVHLELRTAGNIPVYHPFNRAASQPEIAFVSPPPNNPIIHGNKTIMGSVTHTVPIKAVAYSLNGDNFEEIQFTSRYGKAWFSYFCNFTTLGNGHLVFRITDASGAEYEKSPNYTINPMPPIPQIIVNGPADGEVITASFDISGVAFDDVGINSVHWRILGPRMESIFSGSAGRIAREAAARFAENPNIPFSRIATDQNFQIPVDFSTLTDGEYAVEVYAADSYGVKSETVSRTIKVSTAPPETRIISPVITRYNNHAILIKGFSSDANGVDNVNISMDNGNTWQNVILSDEGNWEIALNTVNYADGIYSALIRTVDNYGITSFSNAMVNIDNTPPELYLSSPESGQHVGNELRIMGRVSDNIALKSLSFQIISAENPEYMRSFEIPPQLVIFESMSFDGFPQGEYIVRAVATDLADNETIVSRKVVYDADDAAAEIAIYNPLPGEIHTGPINVIGVITTSFLPDQVMVQMNGKSMGLADVNRYGTFQYEIKEDLLEGEEPYTILVYYNSESGSLISSPGHTVYYSPYGPSLAINTHIDSDVITKRPWLKGYAWYSYPEPAEGLSSREKAGYKPKRVWVSFDNGHTFKQARGAGEWKFRLEAGTFPTGPQPVVVKAEFANNEVAVRRLLLNVDTTEPQVETISPPENSAHRDDILVYGTAGDNYQLADVDISLRPGHKILYEVPAAIKGLYFDTKAFGATYFDVGIGLSLFNNNVRLQGQFGIAPPDGPETTFTSGGRFEGSVYGIKLLANIFHLPFEFLFGPDWGFYSMNLAVGANFSYFGMDEVREPAFMGAVLAQLDLVNIDFQFFNPNWKYFRKYALYLEPELWFASTDIKDIEKIIFRWTVGMRINWF
jgi:hypothetical protein